MLEIYFIRHAQGEHTTDVPESLETIHPALTPLGRRQATELRETITLTRNDLLLSSPTIRTLETSLILAEGTRSPIYVSPLVGPRMFPSSEHWGRMLLCDYILSAKSVKRRYPQTVVLYEHYKGLTNEGLNMASREQYSEAVNRMLDWIRMRQSKRVFIVTHDGTISEYRQQLTGETLTRKDFLGDAEVVRLFYE